MAGALAQRPELVLNFNFKSGKSHQISQSGFYTEQEIYTEACRLQYLLPEDAAEPFGERIRDMSGGQAEIEVLGSVLYYGSSKPKVYKNAGK